MARLSVKENRGFSDCPLPNLLRNYRRRQSPPNGDPRGGPSSTAILPQSPPHDGLPRITKRLPDFGGGRADGLTCQMIQISLTLLTRRWLHSLHVI